MLPMSWITKECHECAEKYKGSQFDDNLCRYCIRTKKIDRVAYALEQLIYYQFGERI